MRKRISLLAASGLVAVGLAATPANAADPVFTLTSPANVGLRPHPGSGEAQTTSVAFRVDNETGTVFDHESTFSVDLTGLKGIADVKLAQDQGGSCTLSATSVTCKRYALWTHDSEIVALDVSAAKGSKVGTTIDLTMTGKTDGASFKAATTQLKVGGPDLVLEEAKLKADMTPGGTQELPIVFSNAGTESVQGVALELNTTHGIGLVEKYDNCAYSQDDTDGQPWNTGWGKTVCTLDGEFEPGAVYELSGALTLKAAPHAFIDGMTYAVHEAGAQPKSSQKLTKPGTGKTLTVKQRQAKAALRSADLDPWNNYHEFDFRVKNTADLVAGGASVKGKAGETVKTELGLQNNGPAWIAYFRSGEDVAMTDIVIPAGAKVTKAPKACRGVTADGKYREENLGAPRYYCATKHVIGETQKFSYPFELKIEKVVADATGSVSVGQWSEHGTTPQQWDPNHANNKAAFVINAKDGGPKPTPTPTTSTGTGATPTPSASATASATPGATAGNGGKPNGDLASTGSTVGPIALGGAALVAAGGALFLVFRRRAAAGA
uniref:LPXTG cell wall anchor domain-containing protein n=1 Tax=Streptomyces sp. NBC_00049 TaxID=2903617 RepID=A0AAU2JUM9_9ACTN